MLLENNLCLSSTANARQDKYIIIITKVKLVGRIRGHNVYRIEATEFLPMQERALHVLTSPPPILLRLHLLF